jgi:hypothetical protein
MFSSGEKMPGNLSNHPSTVVPAFVTGREQLQAIDFHVLCHLGCSNYLVFSF